MINKKGFTRVEIIIVIVLLFILGAIVYFAVDPFVKMAEDRDNVRRSEVVSLLTAIQKFKMDTSHLPAGLDSNTSTSQVIGLGRNACDLACGAVTTEASCVDLSNDLVGGKYLDSIPTDPRSGNDGNTDYYINLTESGRITVGACDPENANTISVSR